MCYLTMSQLHFWLIKVMFFLSGRSGLNLNVRVMHCLMEDHVTSLHDLFTASTKRLVEQIFINKI